MADARETAGREPDRAPPAEKRVRSASPAAAGGVGEWLLRLQRGAGNAAVLRWIAAGMIQRQPTGGGSGGGGKKGGGGAKIGGTRPAVSSTSKDCEDCNAAVAWINSGAWLGDAQPIYKPTAGKVRGAKQADGTWKAEVDITWAYDATSTAEMIIPKWPEMTKADNAAVAAYKSALKAHEEMHFDVTDKIIGALPKTVTATGSDQQDAMTNLQAEVDKYGADAQTAIDTATKDYDTKTGNGRMQSAVGGTNVHLACP